MSGVKRNSRGGGKVVFGVDAGRRFGAGFRARAGADGVGCFKRGDGGVVVGTGPVWARGAEIPVEDEFGRIDHRGHRGHGEGVGQRSSSWNGIAMEVGRLGEPSLPWGFAGRCRAAGRAESGCSGGDAACVAGATLRVADGRVVSELSWEEGWSLLSRKARMVRRAEPFFLCALCVFSGSNELYINKLFPKGLCKTRTVQRVLLQIQSDESKK